MRWTIKRMKRRGHNQFSVGIRSASEEYPLTVGGFTGVGSNQFAYHNKMKFTTTNKENNNWNSDNCATYSRHS